jgi:hypothetical protein
MSAGRRRRRQRPEVWTQQLAVMDVAGQEVAPQLDDIGHHPDWVMRC